jgi:hypothetical protein
MRGNTFYLTLRSDGTYTQKIFTGTSGVPTTTSGHWSYDNLGGSSITFDEKFFDIQQDAEYATPGGAIKPLRETFGRITIGSDAQSLYQRQ